MENRKKLHDYSLLLVFMAAVDVFIFIEKIIAQCIDGTVGKAFESVEPELLLVSKIVFGVVVALAALLAFSEAFIGFKGLKVSREPNADKGYITATKVLLVLSVIVGVSIFVSFFEENVSVVETLMTFSTIVLDVAVYILYIGAAKAVRADFLAQQQ